MKLILAAVRYQFLGFFKNTRVILSFLLCIVICFLLSGRVMEIIGQYETSIQAAEPFLWTFGDAAQMKELLEASHLSSGVSRVELEIKGERNAESAKKSLIKAGFIVE